MRVLIVDDHVLVRRGIARVVKEGFPDAEIAEADGALSALGVMRARPANLALVDVRMPDFDGLEPLRAIRAEWPDVPVIFLSAFDNETSVWRALAEGAAGYLLKDATPEDLSQAIRVAIAGGAKVLSPRVIQDLFEDVEPIGLTTGERRRREYNLTRREYDILALLPEGRSNQSIARSLFVSEKTVKAHLAAIYRKLGVTNRTQAAMMAVQMGLGESHSGVSGAFEK